MNCTGLNSTLRGNLTTCNSSLRTLQKPSVDVYSHQKVMAILLPFAIFIVLINGLVVLLFYKRKKLRTPGNFVLLSLAVSDFISGSLNIPIFITFSVQNDVVLIRTFEVLCKMTAILTSYHIVAVTAEKYIAIVKPFQHRSANPRSSLIIVGLIWIASTVIAVLPVMWNSLLSKDQQKRKMGLYLHLGHDVFCFIAVFLIPYMFIVYAQTMMFRAISSRSEKFKEEMRISKNTYRGKPCSAQERKCIAVFATMAILFAICWLPWFILSFCATMTTVNLKLFPIMLKLSPLLEAFAIVRFSTCIINPFLYTFFKRDFLEALKTTCRCKVFGRRQSKSFGCELNKSCLSN